MPSLEESDRPALSSLVRLSRVSLRDSSHLPARIRHFLSEFLDSERVYSVLNSEWVNLAALQALTGPNVAGKARAEVPVELTPNALNSSNK